MNADVPQQHALADNRSFSSVVTLRECMRPSLSLICGPLCVVALQRVRELGIAAQERPSLSVFSETMRQLIKLLVQVRNNSSWMAIYPENCCACFTFPWFLEEAMVIAKKKLLHSLYHSFIHSFIH
jgi:hypothetical protein